MFSLRKICCQAILLPFLNDSFYHSEILSSLKIFHRPIPWLNWSVITQTHFAIMKPSYMLTRTAVFIQSANRTFDLPIFVCDALWLVKGNLQINNCNVIQIQTANFIVLFKILSVPKTSAHQLCLIYFG